MPTSKNLQAGQWLFSEQHQQACRVIECRTLWNETTCQVWLPGSNAVLNVRADQLRAIQDSTMAPAALKYIVAAARIADALTQNTLLAPIESSVIPLPHQIRAVSRATMNNRVRYLLADEVGLGKTIEAGLIMRELKLRGRVARTLVLAPRGLVTQWVAEMRAHFNEEFRALVPSDFPVYRRVTQTDNVWRSFHQVICSMDSVKPVESRQGWSREQIADYNRDRFEDLISAGWDLVIIDEAHRTAGATDQVARYQLAHAIAESTPCLLLLTATPHQGKTEAFHRLVSLLDFDAFPDLQSLTRDRVQTYVIRTEKRHAIDADGKPLFKPRRTQLVPVSWHERHKGQHALYGAVTEYVRLGYNQSLKEKRSYIGFLMLLMQRLVTSSTRAVRTTLERRLAVLTMPEEQLELFPNIAEEEWMDLDAQEQMENLLKARLKSLKNEHGEVKLLLEAARRNEITAADAKAEALLDWVYRLQQEESDPEFKVLVFTEFVSTQEMLCEFLQERGFAVVTLNGSMSLEERLNSQKAFANEARILVSTDAGGEGLNLQFCHVVINYDIPWNPMRLEQRIGRVDRIGQKHVVRAINFVHQDSVEHRVQEVLEEKLSVILAEFGVDKTADVLDSVQSSELFDNLYVDAILHPENIEFSADALLAQIRSEADAARKSLLVLGEAKELTSREAQDVLAHPLPYWLEQMTVNYLESHGGQSKRHGNAWTLTWPDGTTTHEAVFSSRDAEQYPGTEHLTVESPRLQALVVRFGTVAPEQPIPIVRVPGLPAEVLGIWSLWKIEVHAGSDWNRHRILPLFVHDDNRILAAARRIWDELLSGSFTAEGHLDPGLTHTVFMRTSENAEKSGEMTYQELLQMHRNHLNEQRSKAAFAFDRRHRIAGPIGLEELRKSRVHELEGNEKEWKEKQAVSTDDERVYPEMTPIALVRIHGGTGGTQK